MAKINYSKWSCIQEEYLQTYHFLGIKDEIWSILFEKIENKIDAHQIDYNGARYLLDRYFKRYIDKEIREGRTRIINNLLILIKKQNVQITYLFSEFFKAIHDLSIEIPEEYYVKLKKESVILQKMLAEADLEQVSFQNLESSYQKIALLLPLKSAYISFREVKRIYDRYYGELDDKGKKKLVQCLKDSSYSLKFKYLITYDSIFRSIYDTYCQEIEEIPNSFFQRALLDLSLNDLKYIVESHQQHCYMTIEHLKNQDYLYYIARFIQQCNNWDIDHKDDDSKKNSREDWNQTRKGWRRSDREIYDYFIIIKSDLTKEDKQVIDTLFCLLSKESQEGIQKYLKGIYRQSDPIGKKANSDIQKLKYQFKRYLADGYIIENRYFRDIYSCFVSIKPELTSEDKQSIDTLFERLSKERREGIQGYLKGTYHQKDPIGKKANSDIQMLRKHFKKYLATGQIFRSARYSEIYDYFTSIKPELTNEDKQVIDALFRRLPKERQEGIQEYLKGVYHPKDQVGKKVYNDIEKLKYHFHKYVTTGQFNSADRFQDARKIQDIYSYFVSIKPDLTEEDKQVIDVLFHFLSKERQMGIQGYINRIYHQRDPIGKRAHQDILKLKYQFRNLYSIHLQKFQTLLLAMKEIENHFYQLGYSPEEYRTYKQLWEQEIRKRGTTDILIVMKIFINESYGVIKQIEERRSL